MSDITRIRIDLTQKLDLADKVGLERQLTEFLALRGYIPRVTFPVLATEDQVEATRAEYGMDDISIDDDAEVAYLDDPDSIDADYCWVQAWVRAEDTPMPVTANRVMHYLRSEVEYPATLTLEDATAHALAEIHANHSPDVLLSPSDLQDELLANDLWSR